MTESHRPAEVKPDTDAIVAEIFRLNPENVPSSEKELILKTGIQALVNAHEVHNELGTKGKEPIGRQNKFDDNSLLGDVRAEEAVIKVLTQQITAGVRVHSEEHGIKKIGDNPQYLAVLDGIDGSHKYINDEAGYGTLLGIFKGSDPTYDDYLFSGNMDHKGKRMFIGVKGQGAYIIDLSDAHQVRVAKIELPEPAESPLRMRADFGFPYSDKYFQDYISNIKRAESADSYDLVTAQHYGYLALGIVDLLIEATRKGNLEIGALYGLVSELGYFMYVFDNFQVSSIGEKQFSTFGQGENVHIPVITSRSKEWINDFCKKVINFAFT